MSMPNRSDLNRVADALGASVGDCTAVSGGFSPAARGVANLADGRSVFVKVGTNPWTVDAIRQEARVYDHLQGSFLVSPLAFLPGDRPILVLPDLSHGRRAPPWLPGDVEAVRRTLTEVSGASCELELSELADQDESFRSWQKIAADPGPFLSLGLCTAQEFDAAIDRITEAELAFELAGDSLLHLDLRSDNLFLFEDHVVLVDWNWACRGNPLVDLAFWAPSLGMEGGPLPDVLLPDAPEAAASVSGFFAHGATLPADNVPVGVRAFQLRQAEVAIPWVLRALGVRSA
jgi:hypothetical protein